MLLSCLCEKHNKALNNSTGKLEEQFACCLIASDANVCYTLLFFSPLSKLIFQKITANLVVISAKYGYGFGVYGITFFPLTLDSSSPPSSIYSLSLSTKYDSKRNPCITSVHYIYCAFFFAMPREWKCWSFYCCEKFFRLSTHLSTKVRRLTRRYLCNKITYGNKFWAKITEICNLEFRLKLDILKRVILESNCHRK